MIPALKEIEVLSLFVEDLVATKTFYTNVFGLETVFEDDVAAVMKFNNIMINILDISASGKLVEPAAVASNGYGSRVMMTIQVKEVDAVCADLQRHGVSLLNGPIDRPWGRRTAAFADPAGHVWEVAQVLA
jgi:catechol 2,3-dioxygenase-like lactoylglutathione lyase family enzyme